MRTCRWTSCVFVFHPEAGSRRRAFPAVGFGSALVEGMSIFLQCAQIPRHCTPLVCRNLTPSLGKLVLQREQRLISCGTRDGWRTTHLRRPNSPFSQRTHPVGAASVWFQLCDYRFCWELQSAGFCTTRHTPTGVSHQSQCRV